MLFAPGRRLEACAEMALGIASSERPNCIKRRILGGRFLRSARSKCVHISEF